MRRFGKTALNRVVVRFLLPLLLRLVVSKALKEL